MKEQTLIHVKIDYMEAIQSKKDLLSSERDLIKVLRTIKKYTLLRKEQLNTQLKMQNKMKDLKFNLGRLGEILPKLKIPNVLKKKEVHEAKPLDIKQEARDKDLESQLRDIQERLRKLG